MSSFIKFRGDITAVVWNSTFKTILRELENRRTEDQFAARALDENPIARSIGMLYLTSFTPDELNRFVCIISELLGTAATLTEGWEFPKQVTQFPIDLEAVVEKANKTLLATPALPLPDPCPP
jgi:hypothetical protein